MTFDVFFFILLFCHFQILIQNLIQIMFFRVTFNVIDSDRSHIIMLQTVRNKTEYIDSYLVESDQNLCTYTGATKFV